VPVVPAPRTASGPAGGLVHGVRVSAIWPGGADGEGDDACGWVPGGKVGLDSCRLDQSCNAGVATDLGVVRAKNANGRQQLDSTSH
jgi:hypothetical protein